MEIRNSLSINPSNKQSQVAFSGNIKCPECLKEVDFSRIVKGEPLEKLLDYTADTLSKASNALKKEIPPEKESKLINFFEGFTKKIANSGWFDKLSSKGVAGLAYAVVLGNAAKEAMGTLIYTVQALTNEDLSPDKRKFVGMYDLAVGLISTAFSLGIGLLMVKYQGGTINKLIGGEKAKTLPGYAKAFAGLTFILPVAVQTILGKRIIAPAIATPIAGRLKAKLEAQEAEKNGGKKPQEKMSPMPPEALILAKHQDEKTNFNMIKNA